MSSVAANAQAIRRRLKGNEGDFQRTSLSSDSKEFQSVKMQFHRTISSRKAQISSVEKIKNDFLLERYKRYIWDQEWFHVCTEISNIKISVLKGALVCTVKPFHTTTL